MALISGQLSAGGLMVFPVVSHSKFHKSMGTAAIASTLAPGVNWQLEEIRIHLSAVGVAGDFTATMNHKDGTAYDVVILTKDMTAVTDYVWHCERPMEFGSLTELDFAWANASSRTYGLEVIWKAI